MKLSKILHLVFYNLSFLLIFNLANIRFIIYNLKLFIAIFMKYAFDCFAILMEFERWER